ncbi:hydroxyacid dehydrogenase [Azospirillum soli]|uniref:hydroxyacid dehydrogenase n=1 Tax=Azospirillum soli TaxID=1304799 RepID=UPI0031B855C7|nr:D-3-phosphoglycerate dehydrogenase [Azospirillum soli]
MFAGVKTVVRFDLWSDPAMEERFGREPDIALTTCRLAGPEGDAWAALGDAHVYQISAARNELPRQWHAGADLLEHCPRLLCVSSSGAGYDTVDVAACTKAGVLVVNQAGGNAQSVAEHTIGLMLDLSRRISESDRRLRRERGFKREDVMGREISGKTIGLVGIGHVGRRVAGLAHAFGMTVLAHDPHLTGEEIASRGAIPVAMNDLLERSDVVSLHCPRDEGTLGMMDAAAFARMKTGAVFISTARGGIHDEAALADALRRGHVGGAGLDVWDEEPPPLDHPLLAQDNVVATYHTAGVTPEARRNMWALAAEQIVGVLKGERPPRLINPEAWPAYADRFEAVMGFRPETSTVGY